MCAVVGLAALWLAVGCGGVRGGAGGVPDPDDLHGVRVEFDGGTVRAFAFAPQGREADLVGVRPVFRLYVYDVDEPPIERMRGGYDVAWTRLEDGREAYALIQDVTGADDPDLVGRTFANEILRWDGETLELAAPDGVRAFHEVDALP